MKKLPLLVASLTLLILFSTIANAQSCDIDNVKQSLRKVLYLHFVQPQDNPLNLQEVIDLLAFYLSYRDEGTPTVDCSVSGARSSRKIEELVNEAFSSPSVIPTCIDGTQYGECSPTKPKYCYAGALLEKCGTCGCSAGTCSTTGECTTTTAGNVTCSSNSDCGTGTFTGNYYCSNTYVMRNIVNYTCINPGTAGSSCTSDVYSAVIDYCDPSLNKVCVGGAAACQTNTTTTNKTSGACAVRNSYTGVPRADAPDIGTSELYNGYAKKMVPGVNDNNQLLALCTQTDYDYLMEKYCTTQDNSVQFQVWTFFEDGSPQSTGCAASGCEFHNCGKNQTGTCSGWTFDGVCPSGCAAGSDADCCTQAGMFVLMANLWNDPAACEPGCYSANYTANTTPCMICSGNILDGACPNWCSVGSDVDCATCSPSWQCTSWNTCSNSTQTRTCTDANNCGTTTGKPGEWQACAVTSTLVLDDVFAGQGVLSNRAIVVAGNAFDFKTGKTIKFVNTTEEYCTRDAWSGGGVTSCRSERHPESNLKSSFDISGAKVVYEDNAHLCVLSGGPRYTCPDIYIYNFDTGGTSLVSSKPTIQQNPKIDGNRVTWWETLTASGTNGDPEVWWKDLELGVETFVGYGHHPAISGDYVVYRTAPGTLGIYDTKVYNVLTKQTTTIKGWLNSQEISGNYVVYQKTSNFKNYIGVYNILTGQIRNITSPDYDSMLPHISGDLIVYTSNRVADEKDYDIYMYDLSTNTETLVERKGGSMELYSDVHNDKIIFLSEILYGSYTPYLKYLPGFSCGDNMCLPMLGESSSSCPQDCS